MFGFQMTAVTAGLVGGAMLLFGTAPASAASLPSLAVAAPVEAGMVEEVQRRRDHRARRGDHRAHRGDRGRRYDRRRHGPRYSHRRSGYRHYHGGYYYSSPWWTGPSIGFGITVPGVTLGVGRSSGHVQWCHNRFRSYNAATDSYLGYDGRYHRCNSPY